MTEEGWPLYLYLASGASMGLAGGLAPGPLTALVVSQTLRYGTKEGVLVAFAPVFTDGPLIAISAVALSALSQYPSAFGVVALCGAVFLTWLAIDTARAGALPLDEPDDGDPASVKRAMLTNLVNPHPYLFWAAAGGPVAARALNDGPGPLTAFLVSFFVCIIGAKVAIAVLTGRLRDRLRGAGYRWVMRGLGAALGVFAVLFALDGAERLGWL